jgi:hypothetical protein
VFAAAVAQRRGDLRGLQTPAELRCGRDRAHRDRVGMGQVSAEGGQRARVVLTQRVA